MGKVTQRDVNNQNKARNALKRRGWFIETIGDKYYPVDFLAEKGNYKCLIEYKRRFFPMSTYKTFQMGAKKFAESRLLARELELHALLLVEWDDCLAILDLINTQPPVVIGGRKDRGRDETCPTVDIPLEWFQPLDNR